MIIQELVTQLKYAIDNSGLKTYTNQATTAAKSISAKVNAASRVGGGFFREIRLGVGDATRETRQLWQENNKLLDTAKNTGGAFRQMAQYAQLAAGAFSVRAVFNAVDTWGQMEARLKAATAGAEEYAMADKELARISRLTYKSYSDNAELFVRTRKVMSELGRSTQDTVDLTEALSLGMALSSTKAGDQQSAIDSLSNSVTQGAINLERFQQMQRTMPRLAEALAEGLGKTTSEITAMAKAGKLTTNTVLPAFRGQLAKMRIEAEDMPVTMADAMTVWGDAFQRYFGSSAILKKGVLLVTDAIELLADNIELVVKTVGILGSMYAWSRITGAIMAGTQGMTLFGAALLKASRFARLMLLPFLRMVAIGAALYLLFDDFSVWLAGGDSVVGGILGSPAEWKTQIDMVKGFFATITGFFANNPGFVDMAKSVGILAVALTGVFLILKPFLGIFKAIKLIIPLIGIAISLLGLPLTLLLGTLGLIITYWKDIVGWVTRAANAIWDAVSGTKSLNEYGADPATGFGTQSTRRQAYRAARAADNQRFNAGNTSIQNNVNVTTTPDRVGQATQGAAAGLGTANRAQSRVGSVEATP